MWPFLASLLLIACSPQIKTAPDKDQSKLDYDLLFSLPQQPIYLQLPAEREGKLALFSIWTDYWKRQKQCIQSKRGYFGKLHSRDLKTAMSYVWNGDGSNKNASLTIFRHFDNFFFDVALDDIEAFVDHYRAIGSRAGYEQFVAMYGVRRTNDRFWPLADWFYRYAQRSQPLRAGLFDLNRYKNR